MHTVHTYTHTYYAPIHIHHMYTLIPIAYSTHHYYIPYTHTHIHIPLTTCTSTMARLYIRTLIQPYGYIATLYIQTLYIPMLYIYHLYTTHCYMYPYYITTLYMYLYYYIPAHTLHTYISTPLYKHRLITISHICHTQAPYKYIDIWGINIPVIIQRFNMTT